MSTEPSKTIHPLESLTRANQWIGEAQKGIDILMERIETLTHELAEARAEGTPTPDPKPPKPSLEVVDIRLPHESDMADFYGAPDRNGSYLAWFNFPTDDIVLYSRDGANLIDHTGDEFDDHRCHKALVPSMEAAFAALFEILGPDRFYQEGWHVYAGCFNYRRKTAGTSLSVHSWGAAIDLTAWGTGLVTSKCGFSEEGIEIMEAHGFLWGPRAWGLPGQYENPKYPGKFFDAMHFQAAIPYMNPNSYYAERGLPSHITRWKP